MPRRIFKHLTRRRHVWRENRLLKPFRTLLEDPAYWSLNRKSVTRAFAIGLFIACTPLPLHILIAAYAAYLLSLNLPVILATVLINNPVTVVPLYFLEYWLGCQLLGHPVRPFAFQVSREWVINGLLPVWKPFLLGSLVTALIAAIIGYVVLGLIWHLSLVLQYHKRKGPG